MTRMLPPVQNVRPRSAPCRAKYDQGKETTPPDAVAASLGRRQQRCSCGGGGALGGETGSRPDGGNRGRSWRLATWHC